MRSAPAASPTRLSPAIDRDSMNARLDCPVPDSDTTLLDCKRRLHTGFQAFVSAPEAERRARLDELYHPDAHWRGSAPLDELHGVDAIDAIVWAPLLRALEQPERRDLIVIAGHYAGECQVGVVGHVCGVFARDWLDIPATGRTVWLRYGEFHTVEDGRIRRSTVLFDILDLMRQAGVSPVGPSLGLETVWAGPLTCDGLRFAPSSPASSAASLAQTLAMHATLGAYDDLELRGRVGLLEMPQRDHWHPRMMWYGPAGIGTTRGLDGFVDQHQLPFRLAFPNRNGGNHYVRIGDGPYSATGGWPSVYATHTGDGFMGLAPTGRDVTMRVMDFYLHDEGLIRENWIPLDVIDLLRQLDFDVFDRMRRVFRSGRRADRSG